MTAGYWFSPNYSGCKQPAAQRGKQGTLHRRELAADAAPSLPFHPSAPENPNIRPATSLPMLFFHLPRPCFARPAASYLFSHSSPIASETPGRRRKQDDKHEHPSLQRQWRRRKVPCQGRGWHFLGAERKFCGTTSPPHICVSLLLKCL